MELRADRLAEGVDEVEPETDPVGARGHEGLAEMRLHHVRPAVASIAHRDVDAARAALDPYLNLVGATGSPLRPLAIA